MDTKVLIFMIIKGQALVAYQLCLCPRLQRMDCLLMSYFPLIPLQMALFFLQILLPSKNKRELSVRKQLVMKQSYKTGVCYLKGKVKMR